MKNFVKATYDNYVKNHNAIPTEMKISLRRHPKMKLFVQRMAMQLERVQRLQKTRGRPKIKKTTLQLCVHDYTEMFIKGFKGHADQRIESDLAKSMRKEKEDHVDDMEQTLKGNTQGAAFEDMGLEIPEDQQEKSVV